VGTSAGVPLIFMRPFAVPKWTTWLASKGSTRLSGSLPSYTKFATYLTAPRAVVSLQRPHKKYSGYKNPLLPILYEDQTNVQECMHIFKWVVQLMASEPPRAPGYYKAHCFLYTKSRHDELHGAITTRVIYNDKHATPRVLLHGNILRSLCFHLRFLFLKKDTMKATWI